MPSDQPVFLLPHEAAARIGASSELLQRWIEKGIVDVVRLPGGHVRIAHGRFIETLTSTPALQSELNEDLRRRQQASAQQI